MAPLSGLERSAAPPLWNRVGSFVYAHGEVMYNFQGLRAYEEKFHPAGASIPGLPWWLEAGQGACRCIRTDLGRLPAHFSEVI
jgi:hypothetical protein